jgi:putative Ca2+/H+ antiporter (TMEM165/GDT1 family)
MLEALFVSAGVVALGEMGDKTQVAAIVLAVRFDSLAAVVVGTTLGMMLANVPAVLFGERAVRWVPIAWVHHVAALVFAALGVLVLAGAGL